MFQTFFCQISWRLIFLTFLFASGYIHTIMVSFWHSHDIKLTNCFNFKESSFQQCVQPCSFFKIRFVAHNLIKTIEYYFIMNYTIMNIYMNKYLWFCSFWQVTNSDLCITDGKNFNQYTVYHVAFINWLA